MLFLKVKMLKMGFGECIVVEGNSTNCLMIDCGSLESAQNSNSYFASAVHTIKSYNNSEAMITHFHEDHINGFKYMIDSKNNCGIKFKQVYIPHIFTVGCRYNLIDYMLMYHYLENRKNKKNNFSLLDLLRGMVQNYIPFRLLKRGDAFNSCGSDNLVLWPQPMVVYPEKKQDELKAKLSLPESAVNEIFSISDEICRLFLRCAADGDRNYSNERILEEIDDLNKRINSIDEKIKDSESGDYTLYCNGFSFPTDQLSNFDDLIIVKDFKRRLSQAIKDKDNSTSIVFQTNIHEDYLFTGDVPASILKKIITNAYHDGIVVHDRFFAIKAPHHGTTKHYCKKLFDDNLIIRKELVFISCGNGGKGSYKISSSYFSNNHRLVCTNDTYTKCDSRICPHINTKGCNIGQHLPQVDVI